MILAPVWDEEELENARRCAESLFREQRLDEPLSLYTSEFDYCRAIFEDLLESLVDLADMSVITSQMLVETLSDLQKQDAFRYLAGPPISKDDLKILADVKSLSPKSIKKSPEIAKSIFEVTVRHQLDRRRFPWVVEGREPRPPEKNAAIVASAALWATQRARTTRVKESKQLEEAVMEALESGGLRRVSTRTISTAEQAPAPGEFCAESLLGTRKADVIVRLWDTRVLAIECKESNSSTNSIKRLNNDAAVKAKTWLEEFGTTGVVPAAVLAGVFRLRNLVRAQNDRLALWWGFDLDRLLTWIAQTKSSS